MYSISKSLWFPEFNWNLICAGCCIYFLIGNPTQNVYNGKVSYVINEFNVYNGKVSYVINEFNVYNGKVSYVINEFNVTNVRN